MLGVLGIFGGLGLLELLAILLIVILLFGATRIPALLRSFGEGIRGFRDAVSDDDVNGETEASDAPDDPNAG